MSATTPVPSRLHKAAKPTAETAAAHEGYAEPPASPAWDRLAAQISWYSRGARRNKRSYMRIKLVQIVSAAVIPVLAATDVPTWVAGGLGALIVILESVQQLYQFHANWTHYRSTSEALKHEKYLYLCHAGGYASVADPTALLAERVEGLVSQEHAAWAAEQSPSSTQSQ